MIMYNREYTPERITELKPNEIFVFGSNLAGLHGGGAASLAYKRFGAIWGQGVGLQGKSYAIPTMQGGEETIKPYVDEFIEFARQHLEFKFLVTRIGCGIAAFSPEEIAPLFKQAIDMENVILPKDFVVVLYGKQEPIHPSFITWNAEIDFLKEYRVLMEMVEGGNKDVYHKVKELRAKEFRNTVEIVNQGHYITENGTKYAFPDDSDMMRKTVFYVHEIRLPKIPQSDTPTIVEVQNIDCLYAGVQLKEQGYNPAVLNMASYCKPGGGVETGAGAQEETLFRRTNLFRSLFQFDSNLEQYGIRSSRYQYPLKMDYGGIYTPDAIYFRESEQKGYALLDNPVSLSFIAVAGMNKPELTADGMIAGHQVKHIKNKIRTIFRIGLVHGHDSLVLGALGCGAFQNPPRHVARLFHEVMDEMEFKNKYHRIVFAILEDHNAHQRHNPEGNFKPFVDEFIYAMKDSHMGYTFITHFDTEGYKKLYSYLSVISDKKNCRVPYGRVEDKRRYQVDTLPYHLTVSSSKTTLAHLMNKMDGFGFEPFDIIITGLGIMNGRGGSQVLYYKIAPSKEMDLLRMKLYKIIGNDRYLPENNTLHITICISKDQRKIERIKNNLSKGFAPFSLKVMSIGLYEIWPGKMMAEYYFSQITI